MLFIYRISFGLDSITKTVIEALLDYKFLLCEIFIFEKKQNELVIKQDNLCDIIVCIISLEKLAKEDKFYWNQSVWVFCRYMLSINFCLRILTGKTILKENSNACEKYEYGHLRCWYIKSTFYKTEFLKLKQNFQKYEVVAGKTLFLVIGRFCTHHTICHNTGFWHGSCEWK